MDIIFQVFKEDNALFLTLASNYALRLINNQANKHNALAKASAMRREFNSSENGL